MKTKNVRLNPSDLFKGRIIYLTESNTDLILKARVTIKRKGVINAEGHLPVKGKYRHLTSNGNYRLEDVTDWAKRQDNLDSIPSLVNEADFVLIMTYNFKEEFVDMEPLELYTVNPFETKVQECRGDISLQSAMMMPLESHMRIFSNLKQAEMYRLRFSDKHPDEGELWSIFSELSMCG